MNRPDPYVVLGIGPSATAEEIRSAFRKAVRLRHPDTAAEADDGSVRDVLDAYQLLADPAARARFDASQRATGPAGTPEPKDSQVHADLVSGRPARPAPCDECAGGSTVRVTAPCPDCGGRGEITTVDVHRAAVLRCRRCRGRGILESRRRCENCRPPS